MEVTPQLLKDVEFADRWRGYDQAEVDDFLERVAAGVAELRQRLAEAEARAEAAERRAAVAESQVASSGTEGADAETIRRTLLLAQRTADAAVREAQDHAARTVAAAQERAQAMLAEAEAESRRSVEDTRQRLLQEIGTLEGARDALRGDVALLERHLEESRQRLRASLRDLQEVLDHPELLRPAPAPQLSGVTRPPADAAAFDAAAAAAAQVVAGADTVEIDERDGGAAAEGGGSGPWGGGETAPAPVEPAGGSGPFGGVEREEPRADWSASEEEGGEERAGVAVGGDGGPAAPEPRRTLAPWAAGGQAGLPIERAEPGHVDPGERHRATEAAPTRRGLRRWR
ncbi:MAG TPA: DivIVA domain-containing protein [Acidimicrobiales bacterium]|jgi:cell division initiation protein